MRSPLLIFITALIGALCASTLHASDRDAAEWAIRQGGRVMVNPPPLTIPLRRASQRQNDCLSQVRRHAQPVKRDIIAVGASAGGIEALQILVSTLPPNLPAAVFVVLHIPPWSPSTVPRILERSGPLPAVHARDNQLIEHGRIYIAPPDYHLLLEEQRTVLWRGPKENRYRPAVNALFRSAAVTCGERVTGVVLTGALDDGSAGLWWIKRYGGAAVVQDPDEALMPGMPSSALEYVDSAYIKRLREMGPLLTRLAMGEEFDTWKQKRA